MSATELADQLDRVLQLMKSANSNGFLMRMWEHDIIVVENAVTALRAIPSQQADNEARWKAAAASVFRDLKLWLPTISNAAADFERRIENLERFALERLAPAPEGEGGASSDGGVEGHAQPNLGTAREAPIRRRDACVTGAINSAAGIEPGPSEAPSPAGTASGGPRPLTDYEQRWLASIVERLSKWRSDDHEDNIVLSRHEVITMLEGLKAATPVPQPAPEVVELRERAFDLYQVIEGDFCDRGLFNGVDDDTCDEIRDATIEIIVQHFARTASAGRAD